MQCPQCDSGAVGEGGGTGLSVWVCSACGWRWSLERCESRGCGRYAIAKCRSCGRTKCERHHARRSRDCDACVRQLRAVIKGPKRRGSWERTGRLGE